MTADGALPVEGQRVRLRDATLADADMLDDWNRARDPGGYNDFGPRDPVSREVLAKGPLRSERNGSLIIEILPDGRPIGTIGWRRVQNYGPSPVSDCWNVGIELVADARGRGFGTDAQKLLAEWLLATTDLNRVEASTDVGNVAEQRSLEKAGFVREGTMRGAQFRGGEFHDLVVYSRLRSD